MSNDHPTQNAKKPSMQDHYGILRQYLSIPEFSVTDAEFDIGDVDIEHANPDEQTGRIRLARRIGAHAIDRIETMLKTVEALLQSDAALYTMMEASQLADEEHHATLISIHKELAGLLRAGQAAIIRRDADQLAAFISRSVDDMPALRKRLADILDELVAIWQASDQQPHSQGYFG